ncbi:SagB/ThcOx family dehydrogenase [Streptomyces sp. TRM66268-LWL]|uniref:SagB/ThcOx family dehydrogenase n=1 Tax=Streptomyces polyasparticus TaxID=2767826 RepID=A0ABR7SH37_9ACTN|nr:SagB/ThcOx family dehydrogenase [Streptomyces polyasparticus]
MARARTSERPGPDASPGPAVPDWPGPGGALPQGGAGQLDLDGLLRLSLAAHDPGGRLRPTASAGALHPVDVRLTVGADCPLPPGSYGYDPLRHRVHHLGPTPDGPPPGARIELSVTPQRTVSHYGHRAWPLLLLDVGHAVAALWLAGRALGVRSLMVDLDGGEAHPLDRDPRRAGERALATVHLVPAAVHDHVREHAADGATASASPGSERTPGYPTPRDLLTRRSAPLPLKGTLARDELRAVLATAQEASGGAVRWCAAVDEPEPEIVERQPDGTLRRLATGDARSTLAAWAAGQAWIADAGAVLLGYGCPADADAWQIRRTHLRAGFAVGRAHLTATARGLAARPVGSWQQADLGAALGRRPAHDWIVHGLALGRPEEGAK